MISVETVLKQSSVLLISQTPSINEFVKNCIAQHCALLEHTASIIFADNLIKRFYFDMLLVDNSFGPSMGNWLQKIRLHGNNVPIIVLAQSPNINDIIPVLQAKVDDFIIHPFEIKSLYNSINKCLSQKTNQVLEKNSIWIGKNKNIRTLYKAVKQLAPTMSNVLIEGEIGVGKKLLAAIIHEYSTAKGEMVLINCGSEIKQQSVRKLFKLDKNKTHHTVCLFEVCMLPNSIQQKILNLQYGNLRIIATSRVNLKHEIKKNKFIQELFDKLNLINLHIPPLRERGEDITILAKHFKDVYSQQLNKKNHLLNNNVYEKLKEYPWFANVLELKNIIQRSVLLNLSPDSLIKPDISPKTKFKYSLNLSMKELEKNHLINVLATVNGNKSQAARILGISRKTIERQLQN